MFSDFKTSFPQVTIFSLNQVPIRPIDTGKTSEVESHKSIVGLVKLMLDVSNKLTCTKTPQEKTSLERQIAATDAQIDHLVYELYGLTPEEIAIVEGKTTSGSQSAPEASDSKKEIESPIFATSPHLIPNKEQAWADSAHFYSAKEVPPPYNHDQTDE
jgi:hypothetical protein